MRQPTYIGGQEEGMSLWWSESDAEVIRVANVMNMAGIPIYQIPLRTMSDSQPDTAEVDFMNDPPTVRRFMRAKAGE